MAIFPPEPRMAGVTSKLQDVGASEGALEDMAARLLYGPIS